MKTTLRPPLIRVDPAIVTLRRVETESMRLCEAVELLDEAGGCGRAVQVAGDDPAIRRTAGDIRATRNGLSAMLGRLVALAMHGTVAGR